MPETKADRVRRLIGKNLSNDQIAERVGVAKTYVQAIRLRTGEDGQPKIDDAAERARERVNAIRRMQYWSRRYSAGQTSPKQ
jgi:hypothetical protein